MSRHLGDFDAATTIYGKFTTYRPSTGAPYTLAGTPALSVYKDNSTTQSTSGVTLTADFDSVTGLNHYAIDLSSDGTFYAAGSHFDVVVTTGTVDSVSAVGTVVGSFTVRKNSALKPTTAGRTLDVSSGGEAGLDWANVGSPTTTLNLSGTTIGTTTTATNLTNLPAITTDWLTGTGVAASAVTKIQSGLSTYAGGDTSGTTTLLSRLTSGRALLLDNLDAAVSTRSTYSGGAVASVTGNVGGNVTGSVGSVVGAVGSVTGLSTSTIAAGVWDLDTSGHTTSGTFGAAMSAAGGSGDPWSTSLPGSYASGTAGYIVGNRLDAAVSSRSTFAGGAVSSVTGSVGSVTGLTTSTITTALWAQAMSDLASVPTATDTVLAGLTFLFESARNKYTQTATTGTLYKDNSSTTLGTATVADDGTTFSRSKLS